MICFRLWGYAHIVLISLWLGGCATSSQTIPDNTNTANAERDKVERTQSASSRQTDETVGLPHNADPNDSTFSFTPGTPDANGQDSVATKSPALPADGLPQLELERTRRTGKVNYSELREISGMSASKRYPGLLYAINDSGNAPRLYAIDETGQLIHQWDVDAKNRDWEDMTRMQLSGIDYVVIGDTGDNLRIHKHAQLHFLAEPAIPAVRDALAPEYTITFRFDDGPRNVEAFAAYGRSVFLISKEPVSASGRAPSGVYQLDMPEDFSNLPNSVLIARRVATMPLRPVGLEARLAAAVAGVDLSHPTAMEFDAASNTAYILTYREVLSVDKHQGQSWAEAFSLPSKRVTTHALSQAEALTVSAGRAIWFTSENVGAPLWAIPLAAPL